MNAVGGAPHPAASASAPDATPWAAPTLRPIPAISAGRAYLEIALVFGAFFGAAVGEAAASLAGGYGVQSGLGWGVAGPGAFSELATAGLAVVLVVLLCHRRGLEPGDIGFRAPVSRWPNRGNAFTAGLRVVAWAGLALLVGGIVTSVLQSGTNNLHVRGSADLALGLAAALNAGFLEETVALAFVVVTLEQARRPLPEIVLVAVLLRASYHIYYGPGVVGILLWAGAFVWLYRRGRSLWPLIIVHVFWDLTSFTGQFDQPAGAAMFLLLVLVFLVAPVTWLSERNSGVSS